MAAASVTATPVAFGAYGVFDPMPLTSTGSVEWSCAEPDLAIQIQLGPGQEGGGDLQRTSVLPIFGAIPPGQDISPGVYTDSVVVTLLF